VALGRRCSERAPAKLKSVLSRGVACCSAVLFSASSINPIADRTEFDASFVSAHAQFARTCIRVYEKFSFESPPASSRSALVRAVRVVGSPEILEFPMGILSV
jgi:hypothetical protein